MLKKLRNLNILVNNVVMYNTKNCRILYPINIQYLNLTLYMKEFVSAVAEKKPQTKVRLEDTLKL